MVLAKLLLLFLYVKMQIVQFVESREKVQYKHIKVSKSGFKITHSGLNIKFARFGRGIYFAPNSSKANDYNTDPIRAMFYCKVVLGNRWETEYDRSDLVAPPPAHHSVYGKVGARLNYPEVVVYTELAVKPTHVILYSVGGVV
jgi:hypothetical protein